jgi:hypothetical protein
VVSGDLFQRLLWNSTLVVCFDSSTESEAFLGDKTLPSPHLSLLRVRSDDPQCLGSRRALLLVEEAFIVVLLQRLESPEGLPILQFFESLSKKRIEESS